MYHFSVSLLGKSVSNIAITHTVNKITNQPEIKLIN